MQALLGAEFPGTVWVHCHCHVLNRVLVNSSVEPSIRDAWAKLGAIVTFFSRSPQRTAILRQKLIEDKSTNHTKLIKVCETRWCERHEGVLLFVRVTHVVYDSLIEIGRNCSDATSLRKVRAANFDLYPGKGMFVCHFVHVLPE